jgi:hypothetical protein
LKYNCIRDYKNKKDKMYIAIIKALCGGNEPPNDLCKYPDELNDENIIALQEWCVNNSIDENFTGDGIILTAKLGSGFMFD